MAVRLSALRTPRALLPRNIIFLLLVLISVRGRVNPRVYCGWKDQLNCKKITELIGTQTSYLPACSIVPQHSTLPRTKMAEYHWPRKRGRLDVSQPCESKRPVTAIVAPAARQRQKDNGSIMRVDRLFSVATADWRDGG
jgi:hypothetical protein